MRIATLAASIALLAACATHQPSAPTEPADADPLVGAEWIEATRALRPPTITFTDTGAAGFAGCNRWFAQTTREGDSVRFSGVGATRMMCEPPMMTIESNFLGALERTRGIRMDGDTLTLRDETGAEIGTFLRAR